MGLCKAELELLLDKTMAYFTAPMPVPPFWWGQGAIAKELKTVILPAELGTSCGTVGDASRRVTQQQGGRGIPLHYTSRFQKAPGPSARHRAVFAVWMAQWPQTPPASDIF